MLHIDDALIALTLALFSCALISGFRPAYQHWDSLVYAYLAEAGQLPGSLFAVHVLPNFVLYELFWMARSAGYAGRSLDAFQASNAFLAASSAVVLYAVARRQRNGKLISLCLAITLVGSRAFGYYSGTADLYAFIIPVTILAWGAAILLLTRPTIARTVVSGILGALVVLAWQPNGIFVVLAVLLLLHRYRLRDLRWVWLYIVTLGVVLLAGYAGFGYLARSRDLPGLLAWLRGYFGQPKWGNRLSVQTLPTVLNTASGAFIANGWSTPIYRSMRYLLWLLFGGIQAIGGWVMLRDTSWRRPIYWTTLGWAAILSVASWWFDPTSPKFWMVTLTSTLLALALALPAMRPGGLARYGLLPGLAVLAVGLLGFNFRTAVYPLHILPNYLVAAADQWQAHTQQDDLILVGYDIMPYLQYYADRPNVINPEYLSGVPADAETGTRNINSRIEAALERGAKVYRDGKACLVEDNPVMARWCREATASGPNQMQWQEAFQYNDGKAIVSVYRLVGTRQQDSP